MFYMGIDPGVNGGIAVIDKDRKIVQVNKMPATEGDLWGLFCEIRAKGVCQAFIEKLGGMPRGTKCVVTRCRQCGSMSKTFVSAPMQSPKTMLTMGTSYGNLRMALTAIAISFQETPPNEWQKELKVIVRGRKLTITQKKNEHKAEAQRLFPDVKITHAIADALLIAEYCRRRNTVATPF